MKTGAVVGASTDRRKFGNKGFRAFVRAGWRAIPIHPTEGQVEGVAAVRSISDIVEPLDVVSLYVPAVVGLRLLPEIAAKAPRELWINPGAESIELLAAVEACGLPFLETCSIIRLGFRPADFP